jgi:uncharacterized membrane protein YkvA (DUF1232 family)
MLKILNGLWDQVLITWRLMGDERVPLWQKAIPVATLAYIISPIDILPDVIPFVGQIDDIGLLLASMRFLESIAPEAAVKQHRKAVEARRA